ncbi:hypothetical protein ACEPPN_017592 [Leptodophora sp. 'Broadleaf-Isolate-01']
MAGSRSAEKGEESENIKPADIREDSLSATASSQHYNSGFASAKTEREANNMASTGKLVAEAPKSFFDATTSSRDTSQLMDSILIEQTLKLEALKLGSTRCSDAVRSFLSKSRNPLRSLKLLFTSLYRDGSMKSGSTKPFVPYTAFPKFPELPAELQAMVFEFNIAREPDRVIEVNHTGPGRYVTDAKTPALLHACRLSRSTCLKYYDIIYWENKADDASGTNTTESEDTRVSLDVETKMKPREPRHFFAFIDYTTDAFYFSYAHFSRDTTTPVPEDHPRNFQDIPHYHRALGAFFTKLNELPSSNKLQHLVFGPRSQFAPGHWHNGFKDIKFSFPPNLQTIAIVCEDLCCDLGPFALRNLDPRLTHAKAITWTKVNDDGGLKDDKLQMENVAKYFNDLDFPAIPKTFYVTHYHALKTQFAKHGVDITPKLTRALVLRESPGAKYPLPTCLAVLRGDADVSCPCGCSYFKN